MPNRPNEAHGTCRRSSREQLDDLSQDSEGKDVLKKRLADKRGEIEFLIKMMELSPEMVAVVFHQAFTFSSPAVMDDLMGFEADDLFAHSKAGLLVFAATHHTKTINRPCCGLSGCLDIVSAGAAMLNAGLTAFGLN